MTESDCTLSKGLRNSTTELQAISCSSVVLLRSPLERVQSDSVIPSQTACHLPRPGGQPRQDVQALQRKIWRVR